jgi:hypothetical protein
MPAAKVTTKKTAAPKKAKSTVWRVVAQTGRVGRVHFSGNEADAREYLANNFPHPHVDEFTADPANPVHDVKLVSPDGVEEVYNRKDGWAPKPDYDGDSDEDDADSDEDETEYEDA